MIIWGAILIPIIATLILFFKYKQHVVPWEYGVLFGSAMICIIGFKFGTEKVQTHDIEFWGGWKTKAEYFEPWDERVSCRHTKYCAATCTDSNGNSYSCEESCGRKHWYDVDQHSADWKVYDSNGESHRIAPSEFEHLTSLWKSRTFVDMHRDFHRIDGDKYVTFWDGSDQTLIPSTTKHSYENRVQAATQEFEFRDVDPLELGLFEYPPISGWDQQAILGNGGPQTGSADRLLRFWNAKLGRSKQVHMFILIFPAGTTIEQGRAQEDYWRRGNKNEFILAIGIDSSLKVNWAHVISWTEAKHLHRDMRDYAIKQGTLNLEDLVDEMVKQVKHRFERKQFSEFSYLTVEPAGWAIAITYIFTFFICFGLCVWIVQNRYELWTGQDDDSSFTGRRGW